MGGGNAAESVALKGRSYKLVISNAAGLSFGNLSCGNALKYISAVSDIGKLQPANWPLR